jgi:biofilm PGA synthesis N-glycosyltransferase PgaC
MPPPVSTPPEQALVDPVTDVTALPLPALPGVDALRADLAALRAEGAPNGSRLLATFELTGLDAHERDRGADATNELLDALALRLGNAVAGAGTIYRVGHGRFAVLARVGRVGAPPIMLACAAVLSERGPGVDIDADVRTFTAPGEDAEAQIARLFKGSPQSIVRAQTGEEALAPTLSHARRQVARRGNPPPRWIPYMRISTRFKLSVLCGIAWMGLSTVLAWPWIEQLGHSISLPAAIALVMGIALIPGYLNVQLVTCLLLDHPAPIDPDAQLPYPTLTLLIAAYNEQRMLAQTLAYALEQDYPGGLNVIVIDDGSSDDTASVARGFARLDERLRVLEVPHGGKAVALNAGLRAARTSLVATIDADTLLMPGALCRIVARMLLSPPDTVAVAGSVMVRNSRGGLVTGAQTWDYFLGIGAIKRQQALLQATLVAQGAFSVYDAAALRSVGGWPDCIGEDIVMTWALLDRDGRTTYEPSAVAFTEAPATLRALARQRRRWARGMIEGLRAYGVPLVRRRKAFAHSIIADAMFPYLDLVFTFAFVPGIALALTGNFAIVGPMTLAVLPLNMLLAGVMYSRQRTSLMETGLRVRRITVGFVLFVMLYQLFMSPVSVSGYLQETFHATRRW